MGEPSRRIDWKRVERTVKTLVGILAPLAPVIVAVAKLIDAVSKTR